MLKTFAPKLEREESLNSVCHWVYHGPDDVHICPSDAGTFMVVTQKNEFVGFIKLKGEKTPICVCSSDNAGECMKYGEDLLKSHGARYIGNSEWQFEDPTPKQLRWIPEELSPQNKHEASGFLAYEFCKKKIRRILAQNKAKA